MVKEKEIKSKRAIAVGMSLDLGLAGVSLEGGVDSVVGSCIQR